MVSLWRKSLLHSTVDSLGNKSEMKDNRKQLEQAHQTKYYAFMWLIELALNCIIYIKVTLKSGRFTMMGIGGRREMRVPTRGGKEKKTKYGSENNKPWSKTEGKKMDRNDKHN